MTNGRRPVDRVLPDLLVSAAARFPSRIALVSGTVELDYEGYALAAWRLGRRLRDGAAPGSRIAVLLPNSIAACVAHFGVLASGAQLVPLNPQFTPRELQLILSDARPSLLIGRDPAVAALAESMGIEFRDESFVPLSGDAVDALPPPDIDPDSLALLLYTGGTSGTPKGVELTHRALLRNVRQREQRLPTRTSPQECVLCMTPLFHSYAIAMGLYLGAACAGKLVVLPGFSRDAVFDAVARHEVTLFPGSPTIYTGLLAHERMRRTPWQSLRACYSGAAPLPATLLGRWHETTGVAIWEGYGQTEAGPVLTYNGPAHELKPGSVGLPLEDTELVLQDLESGQRFAGPGRVGEVLARGPQLMRGYRNLPQATAEALQDGWLHTGDIGEFDDEGYLYIRGRKKEMVLVGGFNVYPREIEDVLQQHPDVLEAAVVGVPDGYRGELVHAFVVLRRPLPHAAEALGEHCRDRLAPYKRPAIIDLIDSMPRTGVNKTDKAALREQAAGRKSP